MNIRRVNLILVSVGFIIAAGAFGVYYFNKTSTNPTISQLQPTPSIAELTTSVDDTSQWKTYKGDQYSFKYPTQWVEKPSDLSDTSLKFESPDTQYNEMGTLAKGSFVFAGVSPTNRTLNQIEQELRNYKPSGDAPQILNIERVKIGGIDAIKELGIMGSYALTYTFVYGKQEVFISCNYAADEINGSSICNKILSTFRFLQ